MFLNIRWNFYIKNDIIVKNIVGYGLRKYMSENKQMEIYFEEILPFWNKLSEEKKQNLLHVSRLNFFAVGESMHTGAKECAGLFLIKKGQVRAYIISEAGKEITLYRLFERDVCIFSASCMMKNINFDIFLEAEKETEAYLIPTVVYDKLLADSIEVSEFTNQLLASRFSDVMWIMEQVLFMSFDKRLAIFLLEQVAIEGKDTFYMTQDVIAKHLGSAREVVSRMLKYFSEEGYVKIERGKVTVLDHKKLLELAEESREK